jgi:cold shock CspA family protein
MENEFGQRVLSTKGPSQDTTPAVSAGRRMTGHIVGLSCGHGTGFIRADDGQRVYFHRGDVRGGSFNGLGVGDAVTFDLVEDELSGLRALQVRKDRP